MLTNWENKANENLVESQLWALDEVYGISLARFDNPHGWVKANIHHITRKSLVKYGYLEYDDERDLCRLTDSGLKKIQDEMDEDEVLDNEDSPVEASVPDVQPEAHVNCEGDCDECVHRKVLNLIAAKYPNVARLRDVLLEEERLLKELGL